MRRFDCRTLTPAETRAFAAAPVGFTIERDEVRDGLCPYLVSQLALDVALDTGLAAPTTLSRQHWQPSPPSPVQAGEPLTLAVEEDASGSEEARLLLGRGGATTEHREQLG